MTIYLLRGAHTNEYELQNYKSLAKKYDIQVITTRHTLTPISLPTVALWSPSDLPQFPYRRQLLNRLIGGEQWYLGLESIVGPNDIIHTAETYTPYTHQAVAMRRAGKIAKLICTCWETIPHNNEKFARLRSWKKEAFRYVDQFHTPTVRAKNALVKEGVDPAKIIVIPYGVNQHKFCPTRVPSPHKRPRILTVARLVPEKGIAMIEYCVKALPTCDFILVGSGPIRPTSPNMTVIQTEYKKMPGIYRSSDIFLFPSQTTPTWEEQYGMALVEAMSCGLPIVASSSGAIPEILGDVGIVANTSDDMISAINRIIANKNVQRSMSARARARAAKVFSTSRNHHMLKSLYEKMR